MINTENTLFTLYELVHLFSNLVMSDINAALVECGTRYVLNNWYVQGHLGLMNQEVY